MRFLNFSFYFFAAALACVPAAATESGEKIKNIVFIGDSITQGDGKNAVSYRYSLWKHFVDNGAEYNPQGSMTIFQGTGAGTSDLISSYLGKTYTNRSEGHFGWDAAWMVSGKSEGNRPNTGQNTGGLSDWWKNYSAEPDTATLLMGINDLSRQNNDNSKFDVLLANQRAIIETLQKENPNIRVHVFSLLPSAQDSWTHKETGKKPWGTVIDFNKRLAEEVKTWSTGTSKVTFADITAGFDPTGGIHTYDELHPNARGELILAGNIARALGIGQRTAGLTRRGAEELASQVIFENNGNAGVKVHTTGSTHSAYNTHSAWRVNDGGNIVLNTNGATPNASDIRFAWSNNNGNAMHEFTVSFTVKMNEIVAGTHSANNVLGIFAGNGKDRVGMLYIGESGVYWGGVNAASLLYGQTNDTYKDKFFTKDENTFRVAWISPKENGAASGFYVWLNDQLIGEALEGSQAEGVVSSYKNTLLFGDIGYDYVTSAEISGLSFDATTAWAPDDLSLSPVPEPSAFGLLAGAGALALAASRRRRR